MHEILDLFAKSIVFELQKWFIPKNKWQLTLQGGHPPTCPCAPPQLRPCVPPYNSLPFTKYLTHYKVFPCNELGICCLLPYNISNTKTILKTVGYTKKTTFT